MLHKRVLRFLNSVLLSHVSNFLHASASFLFATCCSGPPISNFPFFTVQPQMCFAFSVPASKASPLIDPPADAPLNFLISNLSHAVSQISFIAHHETCTCFRRVFEANHLRDVHIVSYAAYQSLASRDILIDITSGALLVL